jgi:hypothetical protein
MSESVERSLDIDVLRQEETHEIVSHGPRTGMIGVVDGGVASVDDQRRGMRQESREASGAKRGQGEKGKPSSQTAVIQVGELPLCGHAGIGRVGQLARAGL